MDTNANRLTYLTLRWLSVNYYDELLLCTTTDEIKALVWKHMKPLYEVDDEPLKPSEYTFLIKKKTGDVIYEIPYKERRQLIPKEQRKENFVKGIRFVQLRRLVDWITSKQSKNERI